MEFWFHPFSKRCPKRSLYSLGPGYRAGKYGIKDVRLRRSSMWCMISSSQCLRRVFTPFTHYSLCGHQQAHIAAQLPFDYDEAHHINAMGYVLSKLHVAHSQRPADTKHSRAFVKRHHDHKNKCLGDTTNEPNTIYQFDTVYCGPFSEANNLTQHSQAAQQCKAPTTFNSYSKVPLELKFMIWEHTLPTQPRVIELTKSLSDIPGHRNCMRGYAVAALPPTPDVIKVALVVDRASRALIFRNYVPLKLGLRIRHFQWYEAPSPAPRPMAVGKWLIPGHTVFMSERLGDTVVVRSREVLVFPYRPARHGLDTMTLTHIGLRNLDVGFSNASPGALLEFFEKWWACLPQQEERDSCPVGWEAEIDFWNSTKEHDVPYILEFRGRKPGACRRLERSGG